MLHKLCTPCRNQKTQKEEPPLLVVGAEKESTLAHVPDDSTSALVESIIPLFLPTLRKVLSEKLINDGSVLHNEEIVKDLHEHKNEDNLPIGQIEIKIEGIVVMDKKTVKNDMLAAPEFAWPESDRFDEMMTSVPGIGRKMVVFDLVGFACLLPLGKGIEITFPVDLPMKTKANVEVGCGGDIEKAWIRLEVPRLRLWFASATKKLYVAFMATPKLSPNLHINLDKGNGDFLNFSLVEEGNLDDVVEQVLSGFGPKRFTQSDKPEDAGKFEAQSISSNWVGSALGRKISSMVLDSMGRDGKANIPLEIDLSETIQASIDVALGKPRAIDIIKADIEVLNKELELAEAAAEQETLTANVNKSRIVKSDSSSEGHTVSLHSSGSIETKEVKEMTSPPAFCGLSFCQ